MLGLEHPNTLASRSPLACLLGEKGEYNQATAILQDTITLQEQVHGPEHDDVIISLNRNGLILMRQEEYEQAEKIFQRVVELSTRTMSPEHPSTQVYLKNLAIAREKIRKKDKTKRREGTKKRAEGKGSRRRESELPNAAPKQELTDTQNTSQKTHQASPSQRKRPPTSRPPRTWERILTLGLKR